MKLRDQLPSMPELSEKEEPRSEEKPILVVGPHKERRIKKHGRIFKRRRKK